jgi:outer membrane protein assembly factor BamE (lipoprotein component of BamABCDE complex)
MRRRWKRMLLAALIASITFLYPLLAPTPHRIDQAHADLIVQGMTKEQVEAIFGVPAGTYDWAEEVVRTRHRFYVSRIHISMSAIKRDNDNQVVSAPVDFREYHPRTSLTWTSRHGSFAVWLDGERVVSTDAWAEVRIVPPWQRWWTRVWKK